MAPPNTPKTGCCPSSNGADQARGSIVRELVADIWKHAAFDTPHGTLPSSVTEVNGDLLQVVSRLYWMTGDAQYREWAFALADYYLLHQPLLNADKIALRDHGCEVLGGLAEAYVIAWKTDASKHAAYRGPMHQLLDSVLSQGAYADGMLPNWFNPQTGQKGRTPCRTDGGMCTTPFLRSRWWTSTDRTETLWKRLCSTLTLIWEPTGRDTVATGTRTASRGRSTCSTEFPAKRRGLGWRLLWESCTDCNVLTASPRGGMGTAIRRTR